MASMVGPCCEEMERLFVDLVLHERIDGFRAVQRMCCESVLNEDRKNVLVKAVMGSGKTQAMVASILTLQEMRRREERPFPLSFVVVETEVGSTLVGACMRGLLNHDIYSDFPLLEDFTSWARDTEGDARDFQEVDCRLAYEIEAERHGWEISLHQGRTPGSKGKTICAEDVLNNSVLKQRLFVGDPKKRRLNSKSFFAFRRPVLKTLRDLSARETARGATVIVTYQNLASVLGYIGDGSKPDLVLLDESHSVANNTKSSTWKANVSHVCQYADRVMMFSGTPISRNGSRDPADYLERFRSGAHRLLWTENRALDAGDIVPCDGICAFWQYYNVFLQEGELRQKVWTDVSVFYLSNFSGDFRPKTPEIDIILLVISLARMASLHTLYLLQPDDPARSPCANLLLMSPQNVVGTAMQELLLHLVNDDSVRVAWLVPLISMFGGDGLDAVACSLELQKNLRACCPNQRKVVRKEFIETMSKWDVDHHYNILIASKWAFEGIDMLHLHAVAPYTLDKRRDNIFEQMKARPCRAAPCKKKGYLFMTVGAPEPMVTIQPVSTMAAPLSAPSRGT